MRIVIDGNIGSGKSTQINMLKDLGFKCHKEPIEKWPLDLFYKDKSRWGFLLQMKILETYTTPEDDCIYERCLQSSKDVFWYNLFVNNIVTQTENDVYIEWYNKVVWHPDVNIYLRSYPEECYQRIQTREQTGDSAVSLDYIRQIHDYYELVSYRFRKMQKNRKHYVIIVDGKTPEQIHKEIISVLKAENAMFLADSNRT